MSLVRQRLVDVEDEELLSSIIPKAAVGNLISQYGSLQRALANANLQELARIRGIGVENAKLLQAVCEIARRLYLPAMDLPAMICSSKQVFDRMKDMQYLPVEQFRVMYLDNRNCLIFDEIVAQGTANAAVVSPREVFRRAVCLLAISVILVHNHPSGDPTPSQEDIDLTQKMIEAGRVLDIRVLDHVIIGRGIYTSMKDGE